MIGVITEFSEYLVLNPRRFGASNARAPAIWPEWPPSERAWSSENFEDRTKCFRESLKKVRLAAHAPRRRRFFWTKIDGRAMTSEHGSTCDKYGSVSDIRT